VSWRAAFAAGAIGFGGMVAVYSYVTSLITEVTGLCATTVPIVLAVTPVVLLGITSRVLRLALQTWLMDVLPAAPSLGAALCHSALILDPPVGCLMAFDRDRGAGFLVRACGSGRSARFSTSGSLVAPAGAGLSVRSLGLVARRRW